MKANIFFVLIQIKDLELLNSCVCFQVDCKLLDLIDSLKNILKLIGKWFNNLYERIKFKVFYFELSKFSAIKASISLQEIGFKLLIAEINQVRGKGIKLPIRVCNNVGANYL